MDHCAKNDLKYQLILEEEVTYPKIGYEIT